MVAVSCPTPGGSPTITSSKRSWGSTNTTSPTSWAASIIRSSNAAGSSSSATSWSGDVDGGRGAGRVAVAGESPAPGSARSPSPVTLRKRSKAWLTRAASAPEPPASGWVRTIACRCAARTSLQSGAPESPRTRSASSTSTAASSRPARHLSYWGVVASATTWGNATRQASSRSMWGRRFVRLSPCRNALGGRLANRLSVLVDRASAP